MSTHRIRRPQLYTAMLKDTYFLLCALKDGGTYKKSMKGDYFIFDSYKVHINNKSFEFFCYDKVFLKLHFGSLETEFIVHTDTYNLYVQRNLANGKYCFPMSKDEHFNIMMVEQKIPAWEDIEYLNLIHTKLKELGVEFMKLTSSNFYL